MGLTHWRMAKFDVGSFRLAARNGIVRCVGGPVVSDNEMGPLCRQAEADTDSV